MAFDEIGHYIAWSDLDDGHHGRRLSGSGGSGVAIRTRSVEVHDEASEQPVRRARPQSSESPRGMIPVGVVTQVTLVSADLAESVAFYGSILGAEELYRDDAYAMFRLGGFLVNVIVESEGRALLAPATLGSPGGRRAIMTLEVPEIDDAVAHLASVGVPVLNGPATRPWGPRTATISDPDGYVWELAQAETGVG